MLFGNKKKNKKSVYTTVADVGTMGMHMVACTFIGMGMGYYLDKWLGTKPWMLVIFLILGIVAGFRNLIQEAMRMQKRAEQKDNGDQQDND